MAALKGRIWTTLLKWPVGILAGIIIGIGAVTLGREGPDLVVTIEAGRIHYPPGMSAGSDGLSGYYRAAAKNLGDTPARAVWISLPSAAIATIKRSGHAPPAEPVEGPRLNLGDLVPGGEIVVLAWTREEPRVEGNAVLCGHADGPGDLVVLGTAEEQGLDLTAVTMLLFLALALSLLLVELLCREVLPPIRGASQER